MLGSQDRQRHRRDAQVLREKAKADLQDIWMAETRKEANAAFDLFVETYASNTSALSKS